MKKLTLLLLTAAIIAVFTLPITACKKDNSALCNYEIIAEYDGQKTVSAVMNFTYYNDCENEISDLKFNLYANAYRQNARQKPISQTYLDKAFYNGESFGKIEILSVDNCSSWQVCGSDENVLLVSLLTPIYPENAVKISVKYALELAQVNHRTGVAERAVNLGNFYPVLCHYEKSGFYECEYYSCGDPFVSDCANYTVQLTVPKSYVIASSGNLVKSNESGEKLVCEYELKRARDFAAVLSQNFKTESATLGDCTVTYYYYDDANPQMKLNAAVQSLQYFSDVFGKYVYPTLSVVQTGFCYAGMEYPALCMISDELKNDDAIYTIVHENAHQWWYAMVGNDQINSAWQDEGLAEYSTLLFFENAPEYGFTKTAILGNAIKNYRAYFTVYKQIFGDANTQMTRSLTDFTSEYEYVNICYNKGLIAFDTIKNSLGEEKFFKALKHYYSNGLYKTAKPEDLIACFCGDDSDLEGLIRAFLDGKIII